MYVVKQDIRLQEVCSCSELWAVLAHRLERT